MSKADGAAALLHLSALVTLLTVAYVGIDRADPATDSMDAAFAEVRDMATGLSLQLGLDDVDDQQVRGSEKWKRVDILFPARVILIVAGKKYKLGFVGALAHLVYSQCHIPFFGYFRRHIHRKVVGCMALFAVSDFLASVFGQVREMAWVYNETIMTCEFIILAAIALWVFGTGMALSKLKKDRLISTCNHLNHTVKRRIGSVNKQLEKMVRDFNS